MFHLSRSGNLPPLRLVLAAAVATACCAATSSFAQSTPDGAKKEGESRNTEVLPPTTPAAPLPSRVGDKISLSAGLDFSSHFISFGADVWGGGNNDPFPFEARSTQFLYGTATAKFSDELSGFVNLWSDLNNNTESGLGTPVQEIDFNAGFNYVYDKFTFGVAHNYWMFSGDEEKAFEASVGFNDLDLISKGFALNPSVLAHYRYDGLGGQETALVLQAGVRPTFLFNEESDYPITLAVPAAVAFFIDHYQGGDTGFGYANVGLSASVPLKFIPEGYGAWSGAVTGTVWYTPDDAIPGNPDEWFVVTALSVNVAF